MGQSSRFSDSYKREAVAQAEAYGNVSQTARELGISGKTLHSWKKTYGTKPRVAQLERQLAVREDQLEV